MGLEERYEGRVVHQKAGELIFDDAHTGLSQFEVEAGVDVVQEFVDERLEETLSTLTVPQDDLSGLVVDVTVEVVTVLILGFLFESHREEPRTELQAI